MSPDQVELSASELRACCAGLSGNQLAGASHSPKACGPPEEQSRRTLLLGKVPEGRVESCILCAHPAYMPTFLPLVHPELSTV